MSNFCSDQGRTRVSGEACCLYAAAENPRRTQIRVKRAIYGWKLTKQKNRAQFQNSLTDAQNNHASHDTADNQKGITGCFGQS